MTFQGFIKPGYHFPVKGLNLSTRQHQTRLLEAVDYIGNFAYGQQIESSSPSSNTTINTTSYVSLTGISQTVISPVFAKMKIEVSLSVEVVTYGTLTIQILEGSNVKATIPYNPGGLFVLEDPQKISEIISIYALFNIDPVTSYTIDVKAKITTDTVTPEFTVLKDSTIMIVSTIPRITKNDA